jgi:ubiquinone/menaquinone biosynthesis C-methylase UbiE
MAEQHGVLDAAYHERRLTVKSHTYRLARRTREVEQAIRRYADGAVSIIVDVGTADGMMLDTLKARLNDDIHYIGLDMSLALLRAHGGGLSLIQAEGENLPLGDGAADVVIATAVIEHAADPRRMMEECGRVLRCGGILVLTTPSPMMEKIATMVGLLDEEEDGEHNVTLGLRQLRRLAEGCAMTVLEARKFMFAPSGFPAEETIERWLGPLGLNLVMANQLLVARKN